MDARDPNIPETVINGFNRYNGKAYSDNDIVKIKERLELQSDKKIKKDKDGGFPFSVIQADDSKLYAIYGDEKLGEGSGGNVKYVQDLETGKISCCKIQPSKEEGIFLIKQKLLIGNLSRSRDPDSDKYYFIMPILGKSLDKFMTPEVNKDEKYYILYNLLYEILKMHSLNIAHLDLYDCNVIYNQSSQKLTIVDFEKSKDLQDDKFQEHRKEFDLIFFMQFVVKYFKDDNKLVELIKAELFLSNEKASEAIEMFMHPFVSDTNHGVKDIKTIDFEKIFTEILNRCKHAEYKFLDCKAVLPPKLLKENPEPISQDNTNTPIRPQRR